MDYSDHAPRKPFQPREGRPGLAGGARARKLTATLCVLGWSAFWVFGFLALSADHVAGAAIWAELLAAAAGFAIGMWAYLELCRDAPTQARRAAPEDDPRLSIGEDHDA